MEKLPIPEGYKTEIVGGHLFMTPQKDTYATAGVPVYLIVDPYTGEWHLHTLPKDGTYHGTVSFGFGEEVDLTGTAVGLVLRTDEFPRD
ncbi:Uma2 family endonuclease [Streptomyces hirsutus]|uniref:Uma2 family endonuclease n=1 Tax=Streptomyces hirsutus TaxID=35620 RepID=A0ABZ1H215_9ACTN|nr:Uma2 family endonuclease [Streptomyces hirsutus]WSD11425.1 Uma2 family endonuclease [Streptomyces hirsutus]WTD22626.1 Uma2 family endonuclease [Streptomyces hirsutus]